MRILHLKELWKDTRAAVTVEFVLWVPVFFAIVMLILDSSLLLLEKARMWNIASELTRSVSVGELAQSAVADAASTMSPNGDHYVTATSVSGNQVKIDISIAVSDVGITPFFNVAPGEMSVSVVHRLEPTTIPGA